MRLLERVGSLKRLAREPWLAFPEKPRHSKAFATIFAQFPVRGIAEIDSIAIDSLTAQKRLVEAGFGLALIQESAIAEEVWRGELALIQVGDLDARVSIAAVIRRDGFLNQASQALLAQLKAHGLSGRRSHRRLRHRLPRRR